MLVCIDFKKMLDEEARLQLDDYLQSVDEDGSGFSADMLRAAVLYILSDMVEEGKLDFPLELAEVMKYPEHYDLGRTGLRPLTSSWAKKQYPDAAREYLLTFVDPDHDRVHVLLVYL